MFGLNDSSQQSRLFLLLCRLQALSESPNVHASTAWKIAALLSKAQSITVDVQPYRHLESPFNRNLEPSDALPE